MKIYIDNEFKCHVSEGGDMMAVNTPFFDGKCDAFIEGYRFIPDGMSWTRSDGAVFEGECAFPWMPYDELKRAQERYEYEQQSKELKALKAKLDATIESSTMLEECLVEMAEILYS